MKKSLCFLIGLIIVISVNAQSRYPRLSVKLTESNHAFSDTTFGNGNMLTVSAEWLPNFNKPNGVWGVINSDLDRWEIGIHYSSTIREGLNFGTWEDKRITSDTGLSITNFQLQKFGLMALINITEFKNIGDISILIKTGPQIFNNSSSSAIKYNYNNYVDSVLVNRDSEIKNFSAIQSDWNWAIYTKITRYDRDAKWGFRNSVEINYSAVIKSEVKKYEEGLPIAGDFKNQKGHFSIIGETNGVDFNLSDYCGVDQRLHLGFVKGPSYIFGHGKSGQFVIGASLSLEPRVDRKNSMLTDALSISYEWHSGPKGLSGGRWDLTMEMFSFGRILKRR